VVFTEVMTLVKAGQEYKLITGIGDRASDFAEVKADPKMQISFIPQMLLPGKVLMEERHLTHFAAHPAVMITSHLDQSK
jgi:hypothetical protein